MITYSKKTLKNLASLGIKGENSKDLMPIWNPWPIYNNPELTKLLFNDFKKLVSSLNIPADYFCPIPTSGYPLLQITLQGTGIPALTYPKSQNQNIHFDTYSGNHKHPRVLLIDTNVNTGVEFSNAVRKLKSINAQIVGFVVMVFNDLAIDYMPNELTKLYQTKKVFYLLKVSDLVENRK